MFSTLLMCVVEGPHSKHIFEAVACLDSCWKIFLLILVEDGIMEGGSMDGGITRSSEEISLSLPKNGR